MSTFFALLILGFILAIPILVFVLIIKAIRKKPIKKTAFCILGCFIGTIVSALIFGFIEPQVSCEHEYSILETTKATCTSEGKEIKQCTKCDIKSEEVLPILEHQWIDANCTTPKMCELCGITDGKKGDHKWENATCTTPKTCSSCNQTEGDTLNPDKTHSWQDATCLTPKKCTICNTTEGTAIDHVLTEWEIIDNGTSTEQGTRQQKCSLCDSIINTEKFDSPIKIITEIANKSISKHSAEPDIEVILGDEQNSVVVTGAIYCENDEKIVKDILETMSKEFQKTEIQVSCLLVIGDIDNGPDGDCLAMASMETDGTYNITSMSIDFNTERNAWITSQFSAWDGSHTVLKNLIKDNLNDESSFKHIETNYIDVSSEDKKNQVNEILSQSGYSQRVDIGDLFIMTEFSAKNAFNATIKNVAYGIVDYSADLVTLIGIE